jgi:hypothetical protein
MTTNRQFHLALDALAKLKLGTDSTPPLQPQPTESESELNRILTEIGPLPREALFIGIASDRLPVLLNLHDPLPGPMLVIGDEGAGKTAFLQSIARSIVLTHGAEEAQYAVITNRPEEWSTMESTDHLTGIFDATHDNAGQLVQSLAAWAHSNRNTHQSVLLLVDDLESIAKWEMTALQDFRWLLLRGTARRVWPILTMNASRYGQVIAWIENFRTRIFGRVANAQVAEALGADKTSALDRLEAGRAFTLRENGNWLQFHLPSF